MGAQNISVRRHGSRNRRFDRNLRDHIALYKHFRRRCRSVHRPLRGFPGASVYKQFVDMAAGFIRLRYIRFLIDPRKLKRRAVLGNHRPVEAKPVNERRSVIFHSKRVHAFELRRACDKRSLGNRRSHRHALPSGGKEIAVYPGHGTGLFGHAFHRLPGRQLPPLAGHDIQTDVRIG